MLEGLLKSPLIAQFKKAAEHLTPEQLGPMLQGFGVSDFKFEELRGEALETSPLPTPEGAKQYVISGTLRGNKVLVLALVESAQAEATTTVPIAAK